MLISFRLVLITLSCFFVGQVCCLFMSNVPEVPATWGVVAVAAVFQIYYPKIAWLGIWIGSSFFLLTCIGFCPGYSFTVSMAISSLIVIQSWVSGKLYHFRKNSEHLSLFQKIIRLLMCCLFIKIIFALVIVFILKINAWESASSFWTTYFLIVKANFIGLILFLPLTFILVAKGLKSRFALSYLVLFVGLYSASIALSNYFEERYIENSLAEIEQAQAAFEVNLKEKESEISMVLLGLKGFFENSLKVSLQKFQSYSLNIIQSASYIKAIEWVPIVSKEQRKEFELEMQALYPRYHFKDMSKNGLIPSLEREVYYPVHFVVPYIQNQKVHGLNLGSNKKRLVAIQEALEYSEDVILTDPINLVQNSGIQKKGYLAFLEASSLEDPGLFLMAFDGTAVLKNILRFSNPSFEFSIFDSHDTEAIFYNGTTDQENAFVKEITFFNRVFSVAVIKNKRNSVDDKEYLIIYLYLSCMAVFFLFLIHIYEAKNSIENEVKIKTLKLLEAKEKAELYTALKSQFLANMSHELRTPLHGISGYADLILMETKDKNTQKYAEHVLNSSTHLTHLINDILDLARVESGEMKVEIEKTSINEAIEEVREWLYPKLFTKKLECRIEIPENLPLLSFDPGRLRQIILNLLGNAIKFTFEGHVGIRVERVDKDVKISVFDTGAGIDHKSQDEVFKPFMQVDVGLNRKYGGTGLGLSITKDLVELMDGKMYCESVLGEGSTFICIFKDRFV